MPHAPVPPRHRVLARALRRAMTEAEERLWSALRDRRLDGLKFRRQVPVGGYIADFLCAEARLVVEVDGSQHAESAYDAVRDARLAALSLRTLRFWNHEVLQDLDGVCATILAEARDRDARPASRSPDDRRLHARPD